MMMAFALRACFALLLHWSGYSRLLAPDELTYAEDGWVIALYWLGDIITTPWRYSTGQPIGYFQLNGLFFAISGQTEIPIKIANALVGALTIRYVYLIARDLSGPAVARRAAVYAVFLPSLILWSAVNIRDAWVIFLLVLATWQGMRLQKGVSPLDIVWYALTVFLVSRLRDYLVYILLIPPVAALLISRGKRLGRNFVVAVALALIGLVMIQMGAVGKVTEGRLSLEAIAAGRQRMATGGSAFEQATDISTPGRALAFLPIGLAYFLFSPFPWQITSTLKALSLPEMLFLYYLTPSIVRGLRWTFRERFKDAAQILLLTSLIAASYALGSGNVGTMYRHRAQTIPFFLVFAAIGAQIREGPTRLRDGSHSRCESDRPA